MPHKNMAQRSFYSGPELAGLRWNGASEKLWHRETFTERSFFTGKLLQRETLTYWSFYAQRNFYKEKLLHRETFTLKSFYAGQLPHAASFFTEKLLHREAFTQKKIHRETLCATATEIASPKLDLGAKAKKRTVLEQFEKGNVHKCTKENHQRRNC